MLTEKNFWEMKHGKAYVCWLTSETWQIIYVFEDYLQDSNGMSYHGSELVEIYELPERGSNVAVA